MAAPITRLPRRAEGAPAPRLQELTRARCVQPTSKEHDLMGKGILLWFLGVPIPVIILLLLIF
jgi:hypothetical protein